MPDAVPIVLVPGLNCSARLFLPQIPVPWRFDPVTVGDHTRDETMPAITQRILKGAPRHPPECGHLSTMERPQAVNKALVEWLGG